MKELDFYIGVIRSKDEGIYSVVLFEQNGAWDFSKKYAKIPKDNILKSMASKKLYIVNIAPNNYKISIDILIAKKVAETVRKAFTEHIGTGTDLAGYCILASTLICEILKELGIKDVKTVEGWCSYDDEYYGSDRPYDEHTWVELGEWYIDVTADQFNPGMELDNEYTGIIVTKGLPHGMSYDEPEYYDDDEDEL